MQQTASHSGELNGRGTPDISQFLDFAFYDWVWYQENAGLGEHHLGCWLGPSYDVGSQMSFWVLTKTGHVMSRVTVQHVTKLESRTDANQARFNEFTEVITSKFHDDWGFLGDDKPEPTKIKVHRQI
jgi:hypothetical protein